MAKAITGKALSWPGSDGSEHLRCKTFDIRTNRHIERESGNDMMLADPFSTDFAYLILR